MSMVAANFSNLALLIDADNVSSRYIVGLMAEIARYGTASVRRIYGDWTDESMKGWKACLLDHSIQPIQQFAYTTGKNATDSAKIIDAMDLLYTARFSGFCIVSSDSDFTRLAVRIRDQGVTVYGFGERKTPKSFVSACSKFVFCDVLKDPVCEPQRPFSVQRTPSTSPETAPTSLATVRFQDLALGASSKRQLDRAALDALRMAISNSIGDDDYAYLSQVGDYLRNISPDLNARNYGYGRLLDLVEASGIVNLKWKKTGDDPPIVLVCLKK